MEITHQMLGILHHTLGLRPDCREAWRNHFVAGTGHPDLPILRILETAGMMRRSHRPAFLAGSDTVFVCTDAGMSYAIDNLPPPPPKPKPCNYRDYLNADSGFCFAEWMNINKPFYEDRFTGNQWQWRMRRRDRPYTEWGAVSGDWAPTKKEAKASYKAALRNHNRIARLK